MRTTKRCLRERIKYILYYDYTLRICKL
jgi:hypothetical protein